MYSSKEIRSFTAVELGKKIANKEITSVQATNAYLEQIENTEKDVNAYITVMKEKALERADFIDKKIAEGENWSNLMGVPMAIKDVLCMKDTLTSCGSKILGNFYPTYTSTAVENLLNAGIVVLGKTNMDEFAMGSTTESSYFGATSRCSEFLCGGIGYGYRRFYPSACVILRHYGYQAYLRQSFPLRTNCLRLISRPDRSYGKGYYRLCGYP